MTRLAESNRLRCLSKSRRIGLRFWLLVGANCLWKASLPAWEGHNWNQWKQVTTWRKPALATDQTGHHELVPVLGGRPGDTNRANSVKAWEDRRKQFAVAIRQVLGAPTDLSPPALEVRELGDRKSVV